jgi:hypothetical protein
LFEILKTRRADLDRGAEILLTRETVLAEDFPVIRSAVAPAGPKAGDEEQRATTATLVP